MKYTIKNTMKIYNIMEEEICMQQIFHPELNLYWTQKEFASLGYVLRFYADAVKDNKLTNYQADVRLDDLLKLKKMREVKKHIRNCLFKFITYVELKELGAI